jgi:serine/threonine protein kinase
VRIADFGSSKTSDQYMAYLPGGSYAHAYAGTWPYIAPEVLQNAGKPKPLVYGIEADYWSLGCIVFELESVYGEVGLPALPFFSAHLLTDSCFSACLTLARSANYGVLLKMKRLK